MNMQRWPSCETITWTAKLSKVKLTSRSYNEKRTIICNLHKNLFSYSSCFQKIAIMLLVFFTKELESAMMENARHKVKKDEGKWENEIAFRKLDVQMNEDSRWSNDGTWKEIHAVVSERRQSWLTIWFPIFNNHRIDWPIF